MYDYEILILIKYRSVEITVDERKLIKLQHKEYEDSMILLSKKNESKFILWKVVVEQITLIIYEISLVFIVWV